MGKLDTTLEEMPKNTKAATFDFSRRQASKWPAACEKYTSGRHSLEAMLKVVGKRLSLN